MYILFFCYIFTLRILQNKKYTFMESIKKQEQLDSGFEIR